MPDATLLPCPFCGGAASLDGRTLFVVKCHPCGLSLGVFTAERGAVEAWNRRAPADIAAPFAVGALVAVPSGMSGRVVTTTTEGGAKVDFGDVTLWVPFSMLTAVKAGVQS